MKRKMFMICTLFFTLTLSSCISNSSNIKKAEIEKKEGDLAINSQKEKMNIQIGEHKFLVSFEENKTAREFLEIIRKEPLTLEFKDYSGFEKVGSLDKKLTTNDKKMTVTRGDVVLYNGNSIVVFYGENTWSYTKIARIEELTDLEKVLGSGDITITFSIEE